MRSTRTQHERSVMLNAWLNIAENRENSTLSTFVVLGFAWYRLLLLLSLLLLLLLLLLLHWSFALVWPLPSVHLRSVPATHVDWCLCLFFLLMVKFHMSNFKCHTWPTFAEIISSDLRQRLSMLDVIYRTKTESVDSVRLILWSCNVVFFSMDGMDSGGIGCSGLRWDGSRNLTKEGG